MIKVAVFNASAGAVADADVQKCVVALQMQVSRDFAPVWGIAADVNFYPSGVLPAGAWQLGIFKDSDQADALGYHETTADGLPLGKVFAGSDLAAGASWTNTASHELLEMLADPEINDVAEVDNADGSITFYAKEVCDAVEDDSLGYTIGGVLVSDFVFPAWFMPSQAGKPVDFKGHLGNPFALAAGGYISVLNVPSGPVWQQIMAKAAEIIGSGRLSIARTILESTWQQIIVDRSIGGPEAPKGSRRWRRRMPDYLWRRSEKR